MSIHKDPGEIEKIALLDLVDFTARRVLEVGCGDGRLTFKYAERAAHVTAIDPLEQDIQAARLALPDQLKDHLIFEAANIEGYTLPLDYPKYDIALFSWSL